MSLDILIPFALKSSIVLSLLGIGLNSQPSDATYLLRRPAQLARSLLAMNVILPVFIATIMAAFDQNNAVEVSLVALAVSPVPPILPKKANQGTW